MLLRMRRNGNQGSIEIESARSTLRESEFGAPVKPRETEFPPASKLNSNQRFEPFAIEQINMYEDVCMNAEEMTRL